VPRRTCWAGLRTSPFATTAGCCVNRSTSRVDPVRGHAQDHESDQHVPGSDDRARRHEPNLHLPACRKSMHNTSPDRSTSNVAERGLDVLRNAVVLCPMTTSGRLGPATPANPRNATVGIVPARAARSATSIRATNRWRLGRDHIDGVSSGRRSGTHRLNHEGAVVPSALNSMGRPNGVAYGRDTRSEFGQFQSQARWLATAALHPFPATKTRRPAQGNERPLRRALQRRPVDQGIDY